MKTIKRTNIENLPYYFFYFLFFFNFDLNLLSINKISFEKNTDCVIYEIEYFKNLDSENSLYLIFNNVDAYIEYNPSEDDSESKYLVFLLQTKIEKH